MSVETFYDPKTIFKVKAQEIQDQLDDAQQKIGTLEKSRHRQQQELEDAQMEAERANQLASGLEKKQKTFDRLVDEWRSKVR